MSMMMKPWLHLTKGDYLFFDTVAPSSPGAIFGACLILFLVGVFDRWFIAYRQHIDRAQRKRYAQP